MVKEIDNIPYKEKPWGTAMIRSIINTKQKLGMGNFTMQDLSNELNKPVINKFERKKVVVNHIDEIHCCDLVDMTKYSKINKNHKYIFTNIDTFSKYVWAFAIKSKKKYKILNLVSKRYLKNENLNIFGVDKESAFFSKEMLKFFKDNNVKILLYLLKFKKCFH